MKRATAFLTVAISAFSLGVLAQGDQALPKGFQTTPVLKTGVTSAGVPFKYPTDGKAEIVSVVGELAPGGRTPRHKHPVPTYVYVLEGEITVEPEGGEAKTYRKGDAFVEHINHWHQAFNRTKEPVKILVVFAGTEGNPTTVTE